MEAVLNGKKWEDVDHKNAWSHLTVRWSQVLKCQGHLNFGLTQKHILLTLQSFLVDSSWFIEGVLSILVVLIINWEYGEGKILKSQVSLPKTTRWRTKISFSKKLALWRIGKIKSMCSCGSYRKTIQIARWTARGRLWPIFKKRKRYNRSRFLSPSLISFKLTLRARFLIGWPVKTLSKMIF